MNIPGLCSTCDDTSGRCMDRYLKGFGWCCSTCNHQHRAETAQPGGEWPPTTWPPTPQWLLDRVKASKDAS